MPEERKDYLRTPIGSDETRTSGEILYTDDPNPDYKRLDYLLEKVDTMAQTSAKAKVSKNLIVAPLLQVKLDVKPASKKSRDIEAAEFVRQNLFSQDKKRFPRKAFSFKEFQRQAFDSMEYTYQAFEKTYDMNSKGELYLQDLAPRCAMTIRRVQKNSSGQVQSFQQYIQKNNSWGYTEPIPMKYVLKFTYKPRGRNFHGSTILRTGLFHYDSVLGFWLIDRLNQQRNAMGLSVFTEPQSGVTPAQRVRVRKIAKGIKANENMHLILPYGWKYEIMQAKGGTEIIKSIEHHDGMISVSIGTEYIDLGVAKSGARNLGESKLATFFMVQQSDLDWFVTVCNNELIPEMVDLNYDVSQYPQITCGIIMNLFDRPGFVDYVSRISGVGQLTAGHFDTENLLREREGLPLLTEEDWKKRVEIRGELTNETQQTQHHRKKTRSIPKQPPEAEVY